VIGRTVYAIGGNDGATALPASSEQMVLGPVVNVVQGAGLP